MSDALTGELITKLQQDDLKLLLESDDLFSDITVVTEDEGDLDSEILKSLAPFMTQKAGKRGACVIIAQPTGRNVKKGIQRGPLQLRWTFIVLENRTFNKDTAQGGTGKKAWTIAKRIERIVHSHSAGGLSSAFIAEDDCIVPSPRRLSLPNGTDIPLVAYEVRFVADEADYTVYTTVGNPTITGTGVSRTGMGYEGTAGETITLACPTSGALIYYTLDASHPTDPELNPTSILYTDPFTATAGLLRVRAHKAGSIGSHTIACQFT